jgi:HEAT repeat protein
MKKVTPEDLAALTGSNADPADRVRALSRLGHWEKGKYDKLEPTIASLLKDESSAVRGAAINTLLGSWHREKYLDAAIRLLLEDRDEDYRERERVLTALLAALKQDPEWPVQRRSYEEILRLIAPDRVAPDGGEFDRDRDVDWALLAPLLKN